MICLGFDIAMNHSAAVVTEDGEVIAYWLLTDKPGVHANALDVSSLYQESRKRSAATLWTRLANFQLWAQGVMLEAQKLGVDRAGVENYAMGKKFNAYHIGEFGGVLRAECMRAGFDAITLVTPGQLKTRAGLKARSKEKPIAFCRDELGMDWAPFDAGLKTSDAAGDLADAHVVSIITGERA